MQVTITKDQAGKFYVSQGGGDTDTDAGKPMPMAPGGSPMNPDADKDMDQGSQGTPAKDLQEALLLAGRILSQPGQSAGGSPFDQGMAKAGQSYGA